MRCPTASTRGPGSANSESGSFSALLIAARDSRIAVRESEGAATTTRWPFPASCSEVRATNSSIAWRDPQAWGLTWAMVRGGPPLREVLTGSGYGRQGKEKGRAR
jgi:hypothetical protein